MKSLRWVGSSLKDLRQFPSKVQRHMGYALHFAQMGDRHPSAKALKGFGGADVLEIVERGSAATWRAVYCVRFAGVVYVLHAFQKKSSSGIATPKKEIELIRSRLADARILHEASTSQGEPE